jgi:2-octaprenylphenol hydroxylase
VSLSHVDVVIVGAGVVGLTTALLLAAEDLDLNITLIDAKTPNTIWNNDKGDVPDWDIRTSAITRFTQQIWVSLGVWSRIQKKRLTAYADMAVQDAAGFGALSFSAAEIGEPNLGHIIENKVILTSLWETVLKNAAITVKAPLCLSRIEQGKDARFLIKDNGEQVFSTKLLIAADGPNSWVREQLGIRCDKTPYGQAAIITTVKTERPHNCVAWQRFLPTGPLAFLPLSDPQVSSIVWTQPIEKAPVWCEQSPEEQATTLAHASDYFFGKVTCLNKPRYFPLLKQHVREYVKPGLALVGDAAHVMHPLAGQGVNVGIKDAFVLTEEICRTIKTCRQPIGDYWALRRYERHRRAEVTEMLGLVGGLNTLFKSDLSLIRMVRSLGINHLNQNKWVKNWLMQQALGI